MESKTKTDTLFLDTGGEMGKYIREYNWEATPLGSIATWPLTLRTTLDIVLHNRFPMFLLWGPDLICFYNDAYRPVLGTDGKHPHILGKPSASAFPEIWSSIETFLDQVISGGSSVFLEDMNIPIYRNGRLEDVYWTFSYSPVHNQAGGLDGVLITCIETTTKVLNLKALKESEERHHFVIEAAELATWHFNPETNMFTADARYCDWFGVDALRETDVSQALAVIAEEDRDRVIRAYTKALEYGSGTSYDIEYTIRPERKQERILRARGKAFFNDQKKAYRFTGTLQDVTEQALARKKNREEEFDFRKMADSIPAIIWKAEKDGLISYLSKQWLDFTGQTQSDALGRGWLRAVHPEDVDFTDQAYLRATRDEAPVNLLCRLRSREEGYRWVVVQGKPRTDEEGNFVGYFGSVADVHDQKLAEEAVRVSEDQLRMALEAADLGTFDYRPQSGTLNWSKQTRENFGLFSAREIDASTFQNAIHPDDRQRADDEIRRLLIPENGGVYENEYRVIGIEDGKVRWLRSKGKIHFDQAGRPVRLTGISQDVTSRKLTENALAENELLFRTIANASPTTLWMSDENADIVYVNQTWINWTGRPFEDHLGQGWLESIIEEDRQLVVEKLTSDFRDRKYFVVPFRIRRADGTIRHCQAEGQPRYLAGDSFAGYVGFCNDVTASHLTEKALQVSIERFSLINKATQDGIWDWDLKTNELIWNEAILPLFGYDSNEIPQTIEWWYDHIHHDERDDVVHGIHQVIDSGGTSWTDEYRFLCVDGTYKTVLDRGFIIHDTNGKPTRMLGSMQDITARKNAEQGVRISEERFQAAVQAVQGILWTNNADGKMEGEQPGWRALTGQSYEEYRGYGWSKVVHPEDAQPTIDAWNKAVAARKPFVFEHRLRTVSHGWRNFSVRAIPLYAHDGTIREWVGVHTDITEKRLAEKALEESVVKFRNLLEALPQITWTNTADGAMDFFNQRWYHYSGMDFDRSKGSGWQSAIHPDDVNLTLTTYRQALHDGTIFEVENRYRGRNDEYRWHLNRALPIRNEKGEILLWVGTATDIHEKKELEKELEKLVRVRTRQLEQSNQNLQQFAHVASHDLKEPVRKVKMFTHRLKDDAGKKFNEKEKIYVSKILHAADRMSRMIDGVLAFSTTDASQQKIEKVDLNTIISDIISDLEVVIQEKNASLTYAGLPTIDGATVLLYQLFYNLVNNSLKFTRKGVAPEITITCHKSGDSDYMIVVADNGIGFDPQYGEKVFDTFARLNPKDEFEGTGLGLSLCRKIVDRHHGTITATGIKGSGATISILLPATQSNTVI